ncbi:hypothetical protein EST38_g9835 [Candolleomyces aberdarensis]|uniref:Uncharacterized protein n=1 Tax=Candolleomyces aberdarensis TaxID=2316362 RepID=A0A4Q2D8Y3_9AGAR|nr:hypothetical protein EST38_g9835 [Candolleomyces aberdarensis]
MDSASINVSSADNSNSKDQASNGGSFCEPSNTNEDSTAVPLDEVKAGMEEIIERLKITDTTGPEWDPLRTWLKTISAELCLKVVEEAQFDEFLALYELEVTDPEAQGQSVLPVTSE